MVSIILAVLGLLLGNFVTTAMYRIPRGITLAGFDADLQPPFCGSCQHLLRFYEYLPLLSWISTRGRCNYCGTKIHRLYSVIECAGSVGAVTLYWTIGLSEVYVVILLYYNLTLLAIGLFLQQKKIYWSVTFMILALGFIYHALLDLSIAQYAIQVSLVVMLSIGLSQNVTLSRLFNSSAKEVMPLLLPSAAWNEGCWLVLYVITVFLILSWRARSKGKKHEFQDLSKSYGILYGLVFIFTVINLALRFSR